MASSEAFPQFARLPKELRQQIFLKALPSEHRIISVNITAWVITLPGSTFFESSNDWRLNYMAGAELCAVRAPQMTKHKPIDTAYEYFIKPASTQAAIKSVRLVNREALWVVEKAFPDVIRLSLPNPYEGQRGFSRVFSELGNQLMCLLDGRQQPLRIQVRCNMDRDIFFINNLELGTGDHPLVIDKHWKRFEKLGKQVHYGAEVVREMGRVASSSKTQLKLLGQGDSWSLRDDMHCLRDLFTIDQPPSLWKSIFEYRWEHAVECRLQENEGEGKPVALSLALPDCLSLTSSIRSIRKSTGEWNASKYPILEILTRPSHDGEDAETRFLAAPETYDVVRSLYKQRQVEQRPKLNLGTLKFL